MKERQVEKSWSRDRISKSVSFFFPKKAEAYSSTGPLRVIDCPYRRPSPVFLCYASSSLSQFCRRVSDAHNIVLEAEVTTKALLIMSKVTTSCRTVLKHMLTLNANANFNNQ